MLWREEECMSIGERETTEEEEEEEYFLFDPKQTLYKYRSPW